MAPSQRRARTSAERWSSPRHRRRRLRRQRRRLRRQVSWPPSRRRLDWRQKPAQAQPKPHASAARDKLLCYGSKSATCDAARRRLHARARAAPAAPRQARGRCAPERLRPARRSIPTPACSGPASPPASQRMRWARHSRRSRRRQTSPSAAAEQRAARASVRGEVARAPPARQAQSRSGRAGEGADRGATRRGRGAPATAGAWRAPLAASGTADTRSHAPQLSQRHGSRGAPAEAPQRAAICRAGPAFPRAASGCCRAAALHSADLLYVARLRRDLASC